MAPKVIDLFSGVGGLSLAAIWAGFDLIGAVEKDSGILESHAKNFPSTNHISRDISGLTGTELFTLLNIEKGTLDGIIGGPPCQGFSTIGKRNVNDQRNDLFVHFFRIVSEMLPTFYLAENVPGILSPQYRSRLTESFSVVENDYNIHEPILIDASDFGGATTRKRVFFIGVRKDAKGFEKIPGSILAAKSESKITVREALEGLPIELNASWINWENSWQKIENAPDNEYLKILNSLLDIGDIEAKKRLKDNNEVSGCFSTLHSESVQRRYGSLLQGQQDKVSKSTRLKLDGQCPTLRAGTDRTKGSFQAVRPIHPTQSRVITPREAARLQGFPDWFQFHQTKWHSFRQIGNSVCPVAVQKVLSVIKDNVIT